MIWTFGYRGQRIEDLIWLTQEYGALILDIRLSPRSERPEWNGHALRKSLGESYVHIGELGNVNYTNGGPITIADLNAGLHAVASYAIPAVDGEPFINDVVLMCGCRDRETCHRDVVASAFADRHHVDIHEIRFTWRREAPLTCPICQAVKFRPGTRAGMQPNALYNVESCCHQFVWRPPTS